MTKINILGTEYEIIVDKNDDNPKLRNNDAYAELLSKKIVISQFGYDDMTVENLEESVREVVRHEIVHAFFHESGLSCYCHDEVLVEWIAMQLPKMIEAAKVAEKVVLEQDVIDDKKTEGESSGMPETWEIISEGAKIGEIKARKIFVWHEQGCWPWKISSRLEDIKKDDFFFCGYACETRLAIDSGNFMPEYYCKSFNGLWTDVYQIDEQEFEKYVKKSPPPRQTQNS